MKTIEIIVHCYAEKRPEFAKMLTLQLASLIRNPPQSCVASLVVVTSQTEIVIVCAHADVHARPSRDSNSERRVKIRACLVNDHAELFRRAVMRNYVALNSSADIVWFADCDYLFGPGCLDALAAAEFDGLAFPGECLIHEKHAYGDALLARTQIGDLDAKADFEHFVPHVNKFAIGGLQIVDGASARKYGYCNGTKWVKPVPDATDFLDTKEDRIFRKQFPTSTKLHLPNLYRLRHSASAFEDPAKRLAQTS